LIDAAGQLLRRIYRPEFSYKRAGILLAGLQACSAAQDFLFDEPYQDSRRQKLMKVMDRHNSNANSGKMFWAAEGIEKPWFLKQTHRSPRFTSRWDEILTINI
jgi:DNA polymerase V